jgi:signal transduction histidine kinase
VHDLTTAAGVEAYYEEALREVERLPADSRARLLDEWGRRAFLGALVRNLWMLDRLSPDKAPAIRERVKSYGISGQPRRA